MLQKYKILALVRLSNVLSKFGYKYPTAAATFLFSNKDSLLNDLNLLKRDPEAFKFSIKMIEETFHTGLVGCNEEEIENTIFGILKEYYPTEYNNLADMIKDIKPVIVIK